MAHFLSPQTIFSGIKDIISNVQSGDKPKLIAGECDGKGYVWYPMNVCLKQC